MANRSLIGQTLGKYEIIETLGRGGMAEVYRAYQENLDRYVAIKLMHAFLADEADFLTRFQREAKAMASLNHPNIVSVYDFDVQDGIYYIVMEFVSGGTLKQKLESLAAKRERMPLSESVRAVLEIADALAYAHGRDMVHRDIKPGNIMISAEGHSVLTDFGIAKILSGPSFTATGAMIGTPAYMSPEQGLGQPGDERSDLYALGVLFYQMATGRLPYDADTPLAVILKHVNEPVPPPSELNVDLPEAIQDVLVKAMAKDPSLRYQNAHEMITELQSAAAASNLELATILTFEGIRETPTPPPAAAATVISQATPAEATVLSPEMQTPVPADPTRIATPAAISETEIAGPTPAEPSKRSSRRGIVIAAIVALLILGAAAGFLFLGPGLGSTATPTPGSEPEIVAVVPTDTPQPTSTQTPVPEATADVGATAVAAIAATLTAVPTNTPLPTSTSQPTSTSTPDATATFLADCVVDVELVNSYTFQNESTSQVPIDVNFPMTWVLRNSGTCPLPGGLMWTYVAGEEFGQDGPFPLEGPIAADQEVELQITLVAPSAAGTYVSSWQLFDEADNPVGPEIDFEVLAFVPSTPTPVITDTPTPTPTSEVIEPFGYNLNTGACEYDEGDWTCQLNIVPYGGVGPYTVLLDDGFLAELQGPGPFSYLMRSPRCSSWVHTITVIDDGTGQTLSEAKFYDPNVLFEGGCVRP